MKIELTIFLAMLPALPILAGTALRQSDPALMTFVKNVAVPSEKIRLDRMQGGTAFFSGEATYDLESTLDSVFLHAYAEEVPMTPYIFLGGGQSRTHGAGPWVRIDSLCQGDIGWTRPGKGKRVRWTYSTANRRNQFRIKIGLGNYAYLEASTWRQGNANPPLRSYNNAGLNVSKPWTKLGQPASGGSQVIGYDSLGRLAMHRDGSGVTAQFSRGYKYDGGSRMIESYQLSFAATPGNWGEPRSTTRYRWDNQDRMTEKIGPFGAVDFDTAFCKNPSFRFYGRNHWRWTYSDSFSQRPDMSIREYLDTTGGSPRLTYRTTSRMSGDTEYVVDEGLDTAAGSCYSPDHSLESYRVIEKDAWGNFQKSTTYRRRRGETAFKPQAPFCILQDYDERGNPVRAWLYGECQRANLDWEAKYNGFNFLVERTDYRSTPSRTDFHLYEVFDLDTLPKIDAVE